MAKRSYKEAIRKLEDAIDEERNASEIEFLENEAKKAHSTMIKTENEEREIVNQMIVCLQGNEFPEKCLQFEWNLRKSILPTIEIPLNVFDLPLFLSNRHFENYKIIEQITERVFVAQYHEGDQEHICVLKAYLLLEEQHKRQFIKEALALSKLEHPFIGKLEALFIDKNVGYLQLTRYYGGTLAQYLENPSKDKKLNLRMIHSLFYKIAQTLSYVHGRGLIHCDINPNNFILQQPNASKKTEPKDDDSKILMNPILIDFGIAKEANAFITTKTLTIGLQGTENYIDPALLNGKLKSPIMASDVWSYGVMLYRFVFGTIPPTLPLSLKSREVPIPYHPNHQLRSLLAEMLKYDPEERISIFQVCIHPFLVSSPDCEKTVSGHFEQRARQFRIQLNDARPGCTTTISIRRSTLVNDVLSWFQNVQNDQLLVPLRVRFEGEQAIDTGGVAACMYTEFFKKLASSARNNTDHYDSEYQNYYSGCIMKEKPKNQYFYLNF